jgi:hypothetical protein
MKITGMLRRDMEAASTSETSVSVSEDSHLHSRNRENLKSYLLTRSLQFVSVIINALCWSDIEMQIYTLIAFLKAGLLGRSSWLNPLKPKLV